MKKICRFLSIFAVLILSLGLLAVMALADGPSVVITGADSTAHTITPAVDENTKPTQALKFTDGASTVSVTFTGTATLTGGGLSVQELTSGTGVYNLTLAKGYNDFTLSVTPDAGDPVTYYFRVFRPLLPEADNTYAFPVANTDPGAPESGSADNPYIIDSLAKLAQFAANVNGINGYATDKYFKLSDNIDAVGLWLPIGTAANPFTGHFDFAGHPVSGFELKDEYLKYENVAAAGFFGYVSGAEITNSGTGSALTGTIAYADEDAGERSFGILAGNAADSDITGITVAGSVTVAASDTGTANLGGLVGYADQDCAITSCRASAGLSLTSAAANTGKSNFGGLVGKNAGKIDSCPMTAVSNMLDASGAPGTTFFGGIAGYNTGTISGSGLTVSSAVKGSAYVSGGIAGYSSGTISSCSLSGSSSFSAVPTYEGTNDEGAFGGIAGRNAGSISGCGNNLSSLSFAAPGKNVCIGGIAGENTGRISDSDNGASLTVTKGNCLYLGGIAGAGDGSVSDCANTGSVSATLNTASDTGSDSLLSGPSTVGGIVGNSYGSITNCSNSGSVSVTAANKSGGTCYILAGGIAGQNNSAMDDCVNYSDLVSVDATGDLAVFCGGLAGDNHGRIYNSGNMGDVSSSVNNGSSSTSYTGGATGINKGTIFNCFSNCDTSGTAKNSGAKAYVGGFVGENYSEIQNCYSTGTFEANAATGNGALVAPTVQGGSFAGVLDNRSAIKYCFYDSGTYSALAVGGTTRDSGTGCAPYATDDMQEDEFAELLTGYAGYINYRTFNQGKTLRGWGISLDVNDSYPIFTSKYPLSRTLPSTASSGSDSESDSGSESTKSEINVASVLPSSSASGVSVSDKNANPPTGVSFDPGLSFLAFAAMLIPTAAIAALSRKKK